MNFKNLLLTLTILTAVACSNSGGGNGAADPNNKPSKVTNDALLKAANQTDFPDKAGTVFGSWAETVETAGTNGAVSRTLFQISNKKVLITTICSKGESTATVQFESRVNSIANNTINLQSDGEVENRVAELTCTTGLPNKSLKYKLENEVLVLTVTVDGKDSSSPEMVRASTLKSEQESETETNPGELPPFPNPNPNNPNPPTPIPGSDLYSYELEINGCKTGKREFNSLSAM